MSEHCPTCGYTKQDAAIHLDHHLCPNKNPPWKATDQITTLQTEVKSLREALKDTERLYSLGHAVGSRHNALASRDTDAMAKQIFYRNEPLLAALTSVTGEDK